MKRTQEPFDETKQSMKRHMPTKTSFDEQTSCHGAILNVPRDVTIFFFFALSAFLTSTVALMTSISCV